MNEPVVSPLRFDPHQRATISALTALLRLAQDGDISGLAVSWVVNDGKRTIQAESVGMSRAEVVYAAEIIKKVALDGS
jgi:hypothetical protein